MTPARSRCLSVLSIVRAVVCVPQAGTPATLAAVAAAMPSTAPHDVGTALRRGVEAGWLGQEGEGEGASYHLKDPVQTPERSEQL